MHFLCKVCGGIVVAVAMKGPIRRNGTLLGDLGLETITNIGEQKVRGVERWTVGNMNMA